MSRVVFCSDAPATPFLAGIVRLAYGRLKIQERSRPDGRPREAHGGAASLKVRGLGTGRCVSRLLPTCPRVRRNPGPIGWSTSMPSDKDLFNEEQQMVTMSFGDHIEELRARLILALLGLMVGVVLTFIPPLNLGKRIMTKMEEPAQGALKTFYAERGRVRAEEAEKSAAIDPHHPGDHPRRELLRRAQQARPPARLAQGGGIQEPDDQTADQV